MRIVRGVAIGACLLGISVAAPSGLLAQEPVTTTNDSTEVPTSTTPATTTATETPVVTQQTEQSSDDRDRSKAAKAGPSVTIKDFAFHPKTLTISVGDTVTWTNKDSEPHDATEEEQRALDE